MMQQKNLSRNISETINASIDEVLFGVGFVRVNEAARWRRPRMEDFQDQLVISFGRKNFPAVIYCSPMVSVYCPALHREIKHWFGRQFADNDFGARSLGFYMEGNRFRSWEVSEEKDGSQVGLEIANAFLQYGLPIIEKIRDYFSLRKLVENPAKENDLHNRLLRMIAPCCAAYLARDFDMCSGYLKEMLSLSGSLHKNNQIDVGLLPRHKDLERFLGFLESNEQE
jgi:hypothetical protein